MSAHFFSRWSRRKQGLEPSEPGAVDPQQAWSGARSTHSTPSTPSTPSDLSAPSSSGMNAQTGTDQRVPTAPAKDSPSTPVPTLDDVQQLTPASDFQAFMQEAVPPEVRNAAMKKLFTDPHFNVMDGLDIYIGDYHTPDPLPVGMLQKMVGAQLLQVFAPQAQAAAPQAVPVKTQENPDRLCETAESAAVVAQSPPSSTTVAMQKPAHTGAPTDHDHPDLQLQPNHAPASPDPGSSTG